MPNIYTRKGLDRDLVGEIDGRHIYSYNGWSRELIGEIDGRHIYSSNGWSRDLVGEFDNGYIYTVDGWSRELVGECDNVIGAAALLLLLNRQVNNGVIHPTPNNKERDNTVSKGGNELLPDPPGCSGKMILVVLGVLVLLVLACKISYHMYENLLSGKGDWAYFAMFATALISTLVTNVYARKEYLETEDKEKYSKTILQDGMGFFCAINFFIAYCIYIIEMIAKGEFHLGHIFLGIIVAAVNIFIFAIPFIVLEFIILLIISLRTKPKRK